MSKLTERLVLGGVALVIGLLIGWAVRGVATYNMAAETAASYQDWRTACPPAALKLQGCQMIEEVLDSRSQTPVLRFSIGTDVKGKQSAQLVLPLGVALQPGTGLIVGTDPVRTFPYRTCSTVGCIAIMDMDAKVQASMSTAKDAKVLFAGLDGKAVAIPLSLKGYPEAARAYRSAEARRASWFWRMFS